MTIIKEQKTPFERENKKGEMPISFSLRGAA
jgi:hypothetical protein